MDAKAVQAWSDTFRAGVPEGCLKLLDGWLKLKIAYDATKVAAQAAEPVAGLGVVGA